MAMIGKVLRMHRREKKSVREIVRATSLSRNTVRKYLREAKVEEPKYRREPVPMKLTPFVEAIELALVADAHRPKKERRTAKALHKEIAQAGYSGGYSRLTDFIRDWRARRGGVAIGKAYVPLTFAFGEAFQFDWSEEGVVVGGIYRRLQVSHMKLCASRAFWVIAYPADELRKLTVAAMRDDPDILASPAKAIGCTAFKQALARRALVRGVRVEPEDIIVTQGCSEALALALRATAKQGDTVILESPTYYGFLQLLDSLGLRSLELPTNSVTGLVIDAVEFALRDKDMRIAAVMNMPTLHNPMGGTMSNQARERLVRLCEMNDTALIEDDVYGDFHPSASQLKPQAAFETSGHVIYCASLNKALSPGLRLGWMIGGRWHDQIEALKAAQSRPKEELAQRVAAKYLESGAFDRHLKRLHVALADQREEMASCIRQSFPPGTEVSASDAGMLLWVKLPAGVSSVELCKRAMDERIRIVPGAMFSNSVHFDAYVRISCGSPLDEQRIGAVKRLGRLCLEIATSA